METKQTPPLVMNKTRNRLLILLALLGSSAIAYFALQPTKSTMRTELNDFAVEDTASIDRIFLADKSDNNILLEKRDGKWIVNGLYAAREDAVINLLYTIKELKVRTPVPKSAFESVVKRLSGNSVKVEIYQGSEEASKIYYVGSSNPDHSGTYMLLENSSVPFVVHMEGLYGFLGPRYFTNVNEWRTHEIFASSMENIKSVEINYPSAPEDNFVLASTEEGAFGLVDFSSGNFDARVDSLEIFRYLNLFKKVNFEGFEETKSISFKDSILQQVPMAEIKLVNALGFPTDIKLFKKPMPEDSEDFEGNPIPFDLDRMYGLLNERDFVVVQYFVFDPILKRRRDFLLP
jgi:hypothetical protein